MTHRGHVPEYWTSVQLAPLAGESASDFCPKAGQEELSVPASQTNGWTRIPISGVEDLSDAVLGAGLEVTQMSRAPVTGSLAFATFHGITCTSGYIGGRVALIGPLSAKMVTLGVGLVIAPGTRHWLNEVTTGAVGVFLPGDEHDALYPPGSMYAVVTLAAERLEEFFRRLWPPGDNYDPDSDLCFKYAGGVFRTGQIASLTG
jgi:hypothetical protein